MNKFETNRRDVQRAMRWVWGLSVSAFAGLSVALLFLLAQTTSNRNLYQDYFGWLVTINVIIAGVLALVLVWAAVRLVVRLRRGRFGSRLLVKLAAIFALVGLAPGLLVYVVSYQFVARSIETWFDVKVEGALNAGLDLGRASLDAQVSDLAGKTRVAATQLAGASEAQASLQVDRIRDQLGADDVVLMDGSGNVIAAAGTSTFRLLPERIPPQVLQEVRQQRVVTSLDDVDAGGAAPRMHALALVPTGGYAFTSAVRLLRVSARVPQALATNAIAVQEAYREYQERALGREGLRRMYIGTLTLALILAVFGAVALAVVLGSQLVQPLLVLAEGVRQVSAGDLSPKQLVRTHDELGGLTRAFATMTGQLREAREIADHSMSEVAAARSHLQTILDNLTTGVVVLDRAGLMQSANPGADRVLRRALAAHVGQPLAAVPGLEALGERVQRQFAELPGGSGAHWQETFELAGSDPGDTITIVARGARLSEAARLLVIDDITDVISAQRSIAWGEVARRLAHEIKNPLTPIQLSAERIEFKLADKLDAKDRAVLERSVRMIVEQVDAMKRLVNEFREYARLPVAELRPLDLNALLRDVMQLYADAEAQGLAARIRVALAPDLPRIEGDAAQLRQVVHNLLQNAIDAVADADAHDVWVATEAIPADPAAHLGARVRLTVRDSGGGFSEKILKRAFEPYVTTKPRGTGLGLAMVKKIVDEHRGRIDLANRIEDGVVKGAQVSLSFPALPRPAAPEPGSPDHAAAAAATLGEHGKNTGS